MRSGVIAQKVGMTRVFTDDGRACARDRSEGGQLPGRCCIARKRRTATPPLQLGSGLAKVKNVTKAKRGHFAKAEGRAEDARSPSSASMRTP